MTLDMLFGIAILVLLIGAMLPVCIMLWKICLDELRGTRK